MTDPPPPYKGTLMLAIPQAGCGWSETYWINQPGFEDARAVLERLAGLRLALLPGSACIDQVRVTNPARKRASLLRLYNRAGTFDSPIGAYPWWYSLLMRLGARGGRYSNVYLSGLPRLLRGGVLQPPEGWLEAFERYAAALKENCVLVRGHGREQGACGGPSTLPVTYPIESVAIMKLTTHKRGVGHRRVCGRRRRR